jgi:predicted nucleic acid-binding Zn ribbon protein
MKEEVSKELKALIDTWKKNEAEKKAVPLYKFVCKTCNIEEKVLLKLEEAEKYSGACKICGHALSQVMGLPNADAKITADDYRDKKVSADIEKKLDDRAREHFNKHELPRLIQEKGVEWCKQNGFVDAEGKPK